MKSYFLSSSRSFQITVGDIKTGLPLAEFTRPMECALSLQWCECFHPPGRMVGKVDQNWWGNKDLSQSLSLSFSLCLFSVSLFPSLIRFIFLSLIFLSLSHSLSLSLSLSLAFFLPFSLSH